jgi:CubicO group peptidase (beta-lactamase class C family)
VTLAAVVEEICQEEQVPGVSVGILHSGDIEVLSHGVADARTGTAVTPRTLFQIGSITKTYTATLVMSLVDQGLVELDAPVRGYVHGLALPDPSVTIRHLLTHTAGFTGDHYGRADDRTVADFVASMTQLEQIHSPGRLWSYSNSGFVLLGRVAEVVTGLPYGDALRRHVLLPLGARRTLPSAAEAQGLQVAKGQIPLDLLPGNAPAGSTLVATAADVLRFVQMHLAHGRSPDGTRVVSETAARAMRAPQADITQTTSLPSAMGLGWILRSLRDGQRVFGHDGATPSQSYSFLSVVPTAEVSVVVLTNGAAGATAGPRVMAAALRALTGSDHTPEPLVTPEPPLELDWRRFVGSYSGNHATLTIRLNDACNGLAMSSNLRPEGPPIELAPIDETGFVPLPGPAQSLVRFLDPDTGGPRYLFHGRAFRRVDP